MECRKISKLFQNRLFTYWHRIERRSLLWSLDRALHSGLKYFVKIFKEGNNNYQLFTTEIRRIHSRQMLAREPQWEFWLILLYCCTLKKLVKWKKYILRVLFSFDECLQTWNNSKIRENYHCANNQCCVKIELFFKARAALLALLGISLCTTYHLVF